jgi:hypothetical protein
MEMGLITTARANVVLENHPETNHESFEDRFELVQAAGMGFFGVVFYALIKSDFLSEKSRLKSDTVRYGGADGLQKIKAVKICNPLCPLVSKQAPAISTRKSEPYARSGHAWKSRFNINSPSFTSTTYQTRLGTVWNP